MTLPPFDGPRARQATATLGGEPAVDGGPAGASVPLDALGPPGAPASSAIPAPPPPRALPAATRVESAESLNLAHRPFVNTRPVERVAAILWVLGVVLLAWNLKLFMGYLGSSQATRGKLATLERDIAGEQSANAELQGQVAKLGLEQENREVTFLNRKIEERTFSWSLLFDRLAEVLPDRVRLLRLTPSNVVQREIGLGPRASARELNPPPVVLTLHCEAKDDEALLRFVDNLFAYPAFSEPNLENEEREDSGLLRFDLTVQYQPNAPTNPTSPAARSRTTRPARPARSARTTPTSGTTVPEQKVETLRALPPAPGTQTPAAPAGGGAGGAGAAPAARSPAAGTGSPAGSGLVRVAPPPRWPGAGGPRGPAAPGVPGRPRPPAPVPPPAASEPPPPSQRSPAPSPGPGTPLPPGAPAAGDRR
jgi:Tfp pilus assembly protein PilN